LLTDRGEAFKLGDLRMTPESGATGGKKKKGTKILLQMGLKTEKR